MEESDATCFIGVMDHLWFNKTVLFLQPFKITPTTHSSMASIPQSLTLTSSNSFTPLQDDFSDDEEEFEERPTRVNTIPSKTRSGSSSPSTRKRSRSHEYSSRVTLFQKTMSCRTSGELEEEEMKGFVDLGFTFKAENVCPRMMSVLPGLQRLGGGRKKDEDVVMRPYLSEAWLIRSPDSPLLNLKVPKVSTMADMKKLLKVWAKTVASEIQQEP